MNYFPFWRRPTASPPVSSLAADRLAAPDRPALPWPAGTRVVGTLRQRVLDGLLPQACAVCDGAAGSIPVCAACRTSLPRLPDKHCPRCADVSMSGDLCGHCLHEPPHFDRVTAAFVYAEPIDALVQALKYGHRLHLARWLGEELATAMRPALAEETADRPLPLLVPMPLHPERLAARGFNQALEIARPLARHYRLEVATDLVHRVRATVAQVDLPREERRRNLRGAFDCRADLAGRAVLVVDDVMTSGSSADELARVLKLHGASRVWVAVAARTLDH